MAKRLIKVSESPKAPVILAIVGAESSGKTTLARALAGHYRIPWLPEYARKYLTLKPHARGTTVLYERTDLHRIGIGQWQAECEFLREGGKQNRDLLLLDTDLLVIRLWWQLKYQVSDLWVEQQLTTQPQRHYLITAPNIPWQTDPLREARQGRAEIHQAYLETLKLNKLSFLEIYGAPEQRLQQAISAIREWQRVE